MTAGWHRSMLIASCAVAAGTLLARVLWARRVAQSTTGDPPGVRTDDGVLLHTELGGRADARLTVVLVHGFAARLDEFEPQRTTLRGRARVVLYDQRGHGRSGWRGPRSATIERLAQDLACVVDAVPLADRVILVGHSMGGMAVLALARQRPDLIADRVAAVALLSTSAGHLAQAAVPPALAHAMVRSGMATACLWLLWALAPLIDLVAPLRTRLGRRWLRRRLFGRPSPPDDAVAKMARMWTETSQGLAAALYPAMVAYDATDALEVLRGVPVLVLTGTDDTTIPARHAERLARGLGPDGRLVTVAGAGHMVNLTHPDVVNAALVQLLEQVESTADATVTA